MRLQLPQFILYAEITTEDQQLTISSATWKSIRKVKVQKHIPAPNKNNICIALIDSNMH